MPLVMIACIDGLFGSDNDEEPNQASATGALAVTTQTDGEDLDSDGVGNPVRITNHGAEDDFPFWSPVE